MNKENWLKQAQQELQRCSDELSPEIQDRLLTARRKALDALETPQFRERRVLWPSLAALAAGVVLSFSLVLRHSSGPTPDGLEQMAAGDFELLANSENLQMLDDLEFYQWLDEVAQDAG
ncbi:MAG: hypothetical protein PVG13_10640 [Thiohalophilus sp.]|jgi:hypothetical protein